MIIAREFTKSDIEQLMNFIDEIKKYDGNFEGLDNIGRIEEFDELLQELEKNKHQELIKPSYSPQTTFGVFDDGKLIAGFNLRHELKGNLINHGGNIGYLVRPSERKKGYGTITLNCALKKAKEIGLGKVLVTCREENIGSSRVIEKNGGIYENSYYDEFNNVTFKRYWINLKKRYAVLHVRERVNNFKYKNILVKEENFSGEIYLYYFNEAVNKIVMPNGKCILDNNYKLLEFYDFNSKIKLSAFYDENNEIVGWYFDIARKIGKENGLPYEDDMYLDVVVTDTGEIILLDEDELKEALDKKQITELEFENAYKEAYQLMDRLQNKKQELQNFTDKYLKIMLNKLAKY